MNEYQKDRLNDVVTTFLLDDIPSYTKDTYPKFYQLLDDYYSYLKSDNRCLDILSKFHRNMNIATADVEYLDRYLLSHGFEYLDKILDKRQFALFLLDFYSSAGSLNSYKYLFKALFNTDMRIEYPRELMMVPSNANYFQSYFVYTSFENQNTEEFKKIKDIVKDTPIQARGLTSKLEAQVESIDIVYTVDKTYLKIGLYPPQFEFNINEVVEISFGDISFKEYVKPILNINVKNKGNLYKDTDKIHIMGTEIMGSASIDKISMGQIIDMEILDYDQINADDIIKTISEEDSGYGFVAKVTDDKRLYIYSTGYDYTNIPKVTINNKKIQDGILRPIPQDAGGIQVIKIDRPFVDFDVNNISIEIETEEGYGFEYTLYQNTLHIESGYRSYQGTFNTNTYLTDSYKYQQYSYLLISEAMPSEYFEIVNKFLHTSGYIYFPVLEISSYIKLDLFKNTNSASIDEVETIYEYIKYELNIALHAIIYINIFNNEQFSIMIQQYNKLLDFSKFDDLFNHAIEDYIPENMSLSDLYESKEYRSKPMKVANSAMVEVING